MDIVKPHKFSYIMFSTYACEYNPSSLQTFPVHDINNSYC